MQYEVRCSGERVDVAALNLSGDIGAVLGRVRVLAEKVRGLCAV